MTPPVLHVITIPGTRDDCIEALDAATSGDICIHGDPDRNGLLWNYRNAVRCAHSAGEDWSIFVSDDAQALPGWEDELVPVMRFAPAPFVSLNHFSKHGKRLVDKGIPWGVGVHGIWGPANMIHRSVMDEYARLVEDVAEFGLERYRKWDDGLPTVFNLMYGTKSAMTARALFQHLDIPSVMGHNLGHWRHAESTILDPGPWWGNGRTGPIGLSPDVRHRVLAQEIVEHRAAKARAAT